uniref:Ribosome-binding factor A n=1 Tax=Chromera velia CCMP2878 TaxID=1169474 RepID=A0A0G4HH30_9ALVE|mmetsp:Transcript_42121/g.83160  ORF Transcript_42121/g.83160 Transcript_42121/m.83160 type:complete len:332 (+) Transcript_42121:229-1224(+)|eukprot:Cvel_27530.t1-p1 / transcript=Cvel_27530.t1 / gene=Cvel_27530 / organism=Chromera_velia_CCMP2878 / gene_product=hypothetical protein / transcript_product=hypothetical protein / location=Cvel_scaffold3453:3889-6502(-) / protein_length=331 / sequence_SO=supercontig / SO=protein_coding / is_pseudo=false
MLRLAVALVGLLQWSQLLCCSAFTFSGLRGVRERSRPSLHWQNKRSVPVSAAWGVVRGRRGGLISAKRKEILKGRFESDLERVLNNMLSMGGKGLPSSARSSIDDSVLGGIVVTKVMLSKNFDWATVWVDILGDTFDQRQGLTWLDRNVKTIRHFLAQRFSFRKSIPRVRFVMDNVEEKMEVMQQLDRIAEEQGMAKKEIINRPDPVGDELFGASKPSAGQGRLGRSAVRGGVQDVPAESGEEDEELSFEFGGEEDEEGDNQVSSVDLQGEPAGGLQGDQEDIELDIERINAMWRQRKETERTTEAERVGKAEKREILRPGEDDDVLWDEI